ncbi:MAG: low molecular weight phosphotyrosine protein phosphatase [Cytophagales bacterium]|nr:low molecular weight phosphotyrosine protein phosphatase [Cytophaga sp.]
MEITRHIKVLFVCLGNICRSPMAEGIFKNVLQKEGLEHHFIIDSAGTSQYHIGKNPDNRAIEACLQKGIQLNHKGKELILQDFSNWDYVLAMDKNNMENIHLLAKKLNGKQYANVHMMRDFDIHFKGTDVPDPYYGGTEGFYEVFDMLERSSYELLRYIRKEHSI